MENKIVCNNIPYDGVKHTGNSMVYAEQCRILGSDVEEGSKDIERTILSAVDNIMDVREMLKHHDMDDIARAVNRMTTAGTLSAHQALVISSMLR